MTFRRRKKSRLLGCEIPTVTMIRITKMLRWDFGNLCLKTNQTQCCLFGCAASKPETDLGANYLGGNIEHIGRRGGVRQERKPVTGALSNKLLL